MLGVKKRGWIKMKKGAIKYITAGICAGIANGFFGAGGGMILVPLFCNWAKLEQKKALATSVAVILPMSALSAIIYYLNGRFNLLDALPFLAGGILGGIISGKYMKKVSASFLRKLLGVMIIWGGIRSFMR